MEHRVWTSCHGAGAAPGFSCAMLPGGRPFVGPISPPALVSVFVSAFVSVFVSGLAPAARSASMEIVQTLLKTGFTDLSFAKKWMLRLAFAGLLGGGAVQVLGGFEAMDGGIPWGDVSLRSGAGFLGGFVIGVITRIFFKITALVGLVLAGLGWALQAMGIVDLPWDSFGEIASAFSDAVADNTDRFKDFLSSYLPAGVTGALGLGSGVTQRPQFDDDED